jgi:hypothetical protein
MGERVSRIGSHEFRVTAVQHRDGWAALLVHIDRASRPSVSQRFDGSLRYETEAEALAKGLQTAARLFEALRKA